MRESRCQAACSVHGSTEELGQERWLPVRNGGALASAAAEQCGLAGLPLSVRVLTNRDENDRIQMDTTTGKERGFSTGWRGV
jgi:hypothetical protein